MAVLGAVGVRTDPLMSYNFLVTLIYRSRSLAMSVLKSAIFDVALGGFSECSGLEMSLDVEEYREGGRNSEVLQFPTRVRWSKITLKKGMGACTALWVWHYGFVAGQGKRRDGLILLMNDLHLPSHIWNSRRGLPTHYSGPSLNASQPSAAIESLASVHKSIYQFRGAALGAA